MTDVNVTEKVARAWAEYIGARVDAEAGDARHRRRIVERVRRQERRRSFEAGYAAALAALSDPEVLAGMAGVLREHGWVYTQPVTASRCVCGERPDDMAGHQATAVADWLRGRG